MTTPARLPDAATLETVLAGVGLAIAKGQTAQRVRLPDLDARVLLHLGGSKLRLLTERC